MAAESQQWSHQTWTSSTCTPETARGTHVLRIVGYSQHKGLGVDRFVRSTTFAVGGYHWRIQYYPDGISSSLAPPGRPVLFLKLMSKKTAEVRTRFSFRMVDQATGDATLFHWPWTTTIASFSTMKHLHARISCSSRDRERSDAWGAFCVKKTSELEASSYLRDDCLVIECDLTVIKEPQMVKNVTVQVPPSDLSGNLARLLEVGKGADVMFRVGDELFPAHKAVLAMRSPVFDAQFYGPLREDDDDTASQCSIAIEDMQPAVFRELLHFMYTDAMPSMEGFDAGDRKEMVKHLLVAADRYAVDRLKLMCEGILCRSLKARDVETTLALADAHHCHSLRKACDAILASSGKAGGAVARQEVYLKLDRPRSATFLSGATRFKNMRKWMLSRLSSFPPV